MRIKGKKIIAFLMTVCLLLTSTASIYAASIDDMQNQYDNLDSQIEDLQDKINSLKSEQSQQQQLKDAISQQLAAVRQQVNLLNTNIAELDASIAETESSITEIESQIEEDEELLRQRLKAQYMTPTANILTTILGCSSYSELLITLDNMICMAESDTELLERLRDEKQELVDKQEELTASKAEVEANRSVLAQKQAQLDSQEAQVSGVLASINTDVSSASESMASLKAEQDALEKEIAQAIEDANSGGDTPDYGDGSGFVWPVTWAYRISAPYGYSAAYGDEFHTGIDIARPGAASIYGKPIVAAQTGKVFVVKYSNTGYGNYVLIQHNANLYTLYAHCSSIATSIGQTVSRGQTIAYIGSSGNSTGPHLHFEVRTSASYGSHVNPMNYY